TTFGFPFKPRDSCSLCEEGTFRKRTCSHDVDTLCSPCAHGTYTDAPNDFTACQPCSKCPKNHYMERDCSRTSDVVCSPCSSLPTEKLQYTTGCRKGSTMRVRESAENLNDVMFGDDPLDVEGSDEITEGGGTQGETDKANDDAKDDASQGDANVKDEPAHDDEDAKDEKPQDNDETNDDPPQETNDTNDKTPPETDDAKDEAPQDTDEAKDETPQETGDTKDETPPETDDANDETPQDTEDAKDETPQETGDTKDETPPETDDANDEIPQDTEDAKDETPQETGHTKDETPPETDDGNDETPQDTEDAKDETPQETGDTKNETPPETDDRNDETPQDTEDAKDETPQETDDTKDETPSETDDANDETPQDTEDAKDETPQETGDTKDETPPETDNTNDETPPETDDANNETPQGTDDAKDETPLGTGDTKDEMPPETGDDNDETPLGDKDSSENNDGTSLENDGNNDEVTPGHIPITTTSSSVGSDDTDSGLVNDVSVDETNTNNENKGKDVTPTPGLPGDGAEDGSKDHTTAHPDSGQENDVDSFSLLDGPKSGKLLTEGDGSKDETEEPDLSTTTTTANPDEPNVGEEVHVHGILSEVKEEGGDQNMTEEHEATTTTTIDADGVIYDATSTTTSAATDEIVSSAPLPPGSEVDVQVTSSLEISGTTTESVDIDEPDASANETVEVLPADDDTDVDKAGVNGNETVILPPPNNADEDELDVGANETAIIPPFGDTEVDKSGANETVLTSPSLDTEVDKTDVGANESFIIPPSNDTEDDDSGEAVNETFVMVKTGAVYTEVQPETTQENETDHKIDVDTNKKGIIVKTVEESNKPPTTKTPHLYELEEKLNGENQAENSESESIDDNMTNVFVSGQSKNEEKDDADSKRKTAIIVGVTVGGVAVFALAFFVSRKCRKSKHFKVMKKVRSDDDEIEFRPVKTDPEDHFVSTKTNNGIYRKVPTNKPPSPKNEIMQRATIPTEDMYAVPKKVKRLSLEAPVVSALSESPQEPLIKDERERIKYIDDSTDDEGITTVREKLLPKKSPNLSNVVEETPPPTPIVKSQTSPPSPFQTDSNNTPKEKPYNHSNGTSPEQRNKSKSASS
ncbi:hypothetical protein Btru_058649, partial [Bulinus truncatus]